MVPRVGLEPTRLATMDFESTASTNSATPAGEQPELLQKTVKLASIYSQELCGEYRG